MLRDITEPDWKVFRELRAIALERFSQRVLSDIERIAGDAGKSAHKRYLAVCKLIERQDRELASAFDNPRRSAALLQLARIQSRHLLTEDEMARFTAATRDAVRLLAGR